MYCLDCILYCLNCIYPLIQSDYVSLPNFNHTSSRSECPKLKEGEQWEF